MNQCAGCMMERPFPSLALRASVGGMGKPQLEVMFEDNHLLVVNKPAGLATQGVAEGTASVITRAKEYLKRKYKKPGNVYLGVVSRLDSAVSGVLILARTSKANVPFDFPLAQPLRAAVESCRAGRPGD